MLERLLARETSGTARSAGNLDDLFHSEHYESS